MSGVELPLTFACGGATLIGLLHRPDAPTGCGVVVVPGVPQYRVGSHRQFVQLARDLAAEGYPVLRFDYRGMGDSGGGFLGFEGAGDDIAAAIDQIFAALPELQEVVLFGLCDGASAISFQGASDRRVTGLVLVNPWVRSEATYARTQLSKYYAKRPLSLAFWGRVLRGRVNLWRAGRELVSTAKSARDQGAPPSPTETPLPERVGKAIGDFPGRVLIVLSEKDLTAQEFEAAVVHAPAAEAWLGDDRVTVQRLADANHTYSTKAWRDQIHQWVIPWLQRA